MNQRADRLTVLIDACCLAGALRRNMLLSLAEAGFCRVRWSAAIMAETAAAIQKITEGKTDAQRQINAMCRAFPEAMVDGFKGLEKAIAATDLRDARDAHVLAAAVIGNASIIVTDNLKDFPQTLLAPYGIEAKSADDFIADCVDLDRVQAMAALNRMRLRFKRPELTWEALCQKVEAQGLTQSASVMQDVSNIFK